MISYVAGELVATTATSVIIDHQGIGLEVLVRIPCCQKCGGRQSSENIHVLFGA